MSGNKLSEIGMKPPNSPMGLHQHGNDEEMYIILSGEGLMTIEGKDQRVAKGDMILNQPFGTMAY